MDFIVLVFSIVLLRLNYLFESKTQQLFVLMICLIPFWVVIVKNILLNAKMKNEKIIIKTKKIEPTLLLVFFVFIILLIIACFRGLFSQTLSFGDFGLLLINWITVIVFGLAVFLIYRNEKDTLQLRKGILYAIGMYVCFNVILELLGVDSSTRFSTAYQGETAGKATILSLFGIDRDRVFFPLANGVNSFGSVSGASLFVGISFISRLAAKISHKTIGAIISLASLYAIISTDSRGSILYVVIAICIINFTPIKILQKLPWMAFCSPILPLLSMSYSTIILASGFLDSLSRNANDLQQLGGRLLIWNNVLVELSNPSLIHLLGYGVYGQMASGLSNSYSEIAAGYASPERMSVHNFFMQYILDMGYLGAALFITLLFLIIRQILSLYNSSEYKQHSRVTLGLLIYFILTSTNEVTLTIYNPEIFTIFILLVIANLTKVNNLKQSTSPNSVSSSFSRLR